MVGDCDHPLRIVHPGLYHRSDLDRTDRRPDCDAAREKLRDRSIVVRGRFPRDAADKLSDAADVALDFLSQGDRTAEHASQGHVLGRYPIHLLPDFGTDSHSDVPRDRDVATESNVWELMAETK